MVAALGIAVVVLSVITLLNVALILAVIRRMRESQMWDRHDSTPAPGTMVGAFTETSVDGLDISERSLAVGTHLVLFLSASCQPCRELVETIENGTQLPEGSLAFLTRDAEDGAVTEMADRIRRLLPVAIDSTGSVGRAFQVDAFPTVVLVTAGVVTAAGHQLGDILAAASSHPA